MSDAEHRQHADHPRVGVLPLLIGPPGHHKVVIGRVPVGRVAHVQAGAVLLHDHAGH